MSATENWPPPHVPSTVPVYAYNEISTSLAPEQVWPVLVDATAWPEWYSNARDVEIHDGADVLASDSTFTWTTFGLRVTSTVQEFVPFRRLGWEGKGRGSIGYHRWDIRPVPGGGCQIVTEEVQNGLLARLLSPLVRRSIERQHQRWLEALVRTADAVAKGADQA